MPRQAVVRLRFPIPPLRHLGLPPVPGSQRVDLSANRGTSSAVLPSLTSSRRQKYSSWQQISYFRERADWDWQVVNHFDPHQHARDEHGNPSCPSHSIVYNQITIGPSAHFDYRHPPRRRAVPSDLPMKFERVCAGSTRSWQPKFSRIDIEEYPQVLLPHRHDPREY